MSDTLDTRQLQAFVTLAYSRSFTEAAKVLNLTQSAISHAIKALERDLGCRIFDRAGRRTVLNQAGEQLLAHAERILREMSDARAGIAELGRWGRGRLRLGTSAAICQHLLPPVLREFRESYPNCSISIEPGDAIGTVRALNEGRIDLGISMEPRRQEGLEFIPLFEDELLYAVSPLHPWAQERRAVRREIVQQNFILYSKSSLTAILIEEYFRDEGISLPLFIELGSMEAIRELVKLGIGVGIMAEWPVREAVLEGSVVMIPLGRRKLKRRWGLLHRASRRLALAEETFAGLCRAAATRFEASRRTDNSL